MPELPEVETIVRSLRAPYNQKGVAEQALNARQGVVGRIISGSTVLWERTLAEPSLEEFLERIRSQPIRAVERRGKFIVLPLDEDTLLIHLRMSGDLRVENGSAPVQNHDRLLIDFTDGDRLVFNDTRKFGRVWLVKDIQSVVGGLGPEPFDDSFNGSVLYERLKNSSRAIKTLLLDQTMIAGIGNIYSDEALHRAGLHPLLPGRELDPSQSERLLFSIRETLAEGILRNGASFDWVYRGGDFQNHFRVYQRTGEPCLVCGTKIERQVINQRSSHYCPKCQPLIKRS
jgi:formamidopyrimidine-DNA glycosylase